jgi:methyl coenzyme M reductase subunit C-like uncharacterized protein (methanogenesis marker protein 7)
LMEKAWASGKRLLLMGSSAFMADELPGEVAERLDEAMGRDITIVVGEARGACRRFQDYLESRGYGDVIVGHARSIRYNAGAWRTVRYGDDLKERERAMIEECDSAVVIWVDGSGQIAQNLELLKRLGKPTYVYECSNKNERTSFGMIDPIRAYGRPIRRLRARREIDANRLSEVVDAFLTSGEENIIVEGENPSLTGYYLNKLIMERELAGELRVEVKSGFCHLRRVTE